MANFYICSTCVLDACFIIIFYSEQKLIKLKLYRLSKLCVICVFDVQWGTFYVVSGNLMCALHYYFVYDETDKCAFDFTQNYRN